MPSNKDRLYVALYARGGTPTMPGKEDTYHWALIMGPKVEAEDGMGVRYHAKERPKLGGGSEWFFEERQCPLAPTSMLLAGKDALKPRPGVQAMENWKTVSLALNGQLWNFTGTPCQHVPGGQVTGFIIVGPEFGSTDGLPNAIWYSGDTLYLPELAGMRKQFHIKAAVVNMGAAYLISDVGEPYRIIMNGTEVAQIFQDIRAEVLVPLHYDSFSHFPEGKDDARRDFELAGVADKIHWVTSGQSTTIF